MIQEQHHRIQKTFVVTIDDSKPKNLPAENNVNQTQSLPEDDQNYLCVDRATSPVPDPFQQLKSVKYRRVTALEKPLSFSANEAFGENINHRVSLPPPTDLTEKFFTANTKKTTDEEKSESERFLVVRRLKILQVSEYEIQTEKYEDIDFSSVTEQQTALLKLLYPSDE